MACAAACSLSCASHSPSANLPVAKALAEDARAAETPPADAAPTPPPAAYAPAFKETSKGHWENGIFTVVFVVGTRNEHMESPKPPSHFRVTYTGGKKNTHAIVESWQNRDNYPESGYQGYQGPSRVTVLSSPDPRKILISDSVANDCCASTAGTIVTAEPSGKLEIKYYELPVSGKAITEGEDPWVSDFTGDQVTFRYSESKDVITAKFKDLEVVSHPRQPG